MGQGIILRVLEGTKLSDELIETLGKFLPNYQLEYYNEKPDYQASINRRIESLYESFLFILDAYPPSPKFASNITVDTLKEYALKCKKACHLSNKSLDDSHKELELFTAKLVDVLSTIWTWSEEKSYKEAIACLNEAEQYVLMSKGRPDLVTLTPLKWNNETRYLIQMDESIPPYYDKLLKELEELKRQNCCKTPAWFRMLPEYQQVYFCSIEFKEFELKLVKQDIISLIEKIKERKKTSISFFKDLESIQKEELPCPTWYEELQPCSKEMIKVLSSDAMCLENKLSEFSQDLNKYVQNENFLYSVQNVLKLPQWYLVLSDRQQAFLGHVLNTAPSIKSAISYISSRHRTLPAPANYAAHSVYIAREDGKIELLMNKSYRSSHIASRDVIGWQELVVKRHCESNLLKVIENANGGQEVFIQTLISPIYAVDYVPDQVKVILPELPPDLELFKTASKAIKNSKKAEDIFSHNHPLNKAKLLYYTQVDDQNSLKILKAAEKHMSLSPGLEELCCEYKQLLNSSLGSATFWDNIGRELYLSSLEHLIFIKMDGYCYGSCVSGKDRKAIQLIHTAAMLLYKEKYGYWPKFSDPKGEEKRTNFIDIVATLYLTRHQHIHAGQNAPGSDGIKTPTEYLPSDICDLINARLECPRGLEFDDRLATDNEVRHISHEIKKYFLPENELLCRLMANQLGEKRCQKLYDALFPLINQKKSFAVKSNSDVLRWVSLGLFPDPSEQGNTPKGIIKIKGLMDDENSGQNNVERLEKIFITVLNRPFSNNSRTKATNSVYDRIRELFKPRDNNKTLDSLVDEIIEEWEELFSKSKNEKGFRVFSY